MVPLFPILRPFLAAAYLAATPVAGADRIFPGVHPHTQLRERLAESIAAAGLTAWPKIFHNLRASRQTELVAAAHPDADVCAWMGNSPRVAAAHYLMPISSSFEKASGGGMAQPGAESGAVVVHNPVQTATDQKRLRTTESTQPLDDAGVSRILSSVVAYCHSDRMLYPRVVAGSRSLSRLSAIPLNEA